MIKVGMKANIRNNTYKKYFLLKNLEGNKFRKVAENFKALYYGLMYQICLDIEGMTKEDCRREARKWTNEYFDTRKFK